MVFTAARQNIKDRGRAPIPFLERLVEWGKIAPAEIFAPNRVPVDAYTVLKSSLATQKGEDGAGTPIYAWDNPEHRRAAMLELMRVHAGRESSWKWSEGVDRTNASSMANQTGEEAGIFQVSFDSTWLDSVEGKDIMGEFATLRGIDKPERFIPFMKNEENWKDIFEYYARLVRVSIRWAGPLLRHTEDSVYPYLSRDSMRELGALVAAK